MSAASGGPAFPMHATPQSELLYGTSLRDYFAAMVLASGARDPEELIPKTAADVARSCYAVADAMLAERAK